MVVVRNLDKLIRCEAPQYDLQWAAQNSAHIASTASGRAMAAVSSPRRWKRTGHGRNPRARRLKAKNFTQAPSWFQDLTPMKTG